jgi:uncharacterized protein YyaL (SSP411 family)
MGYFKLAKLRIAGALTLSMIVSAAGAATPIGWQTRWSDALFAQAAKEHRFVLLDLHAVWCHWCHVMDETTYADGEVQRLVGTSYVAVSIDADSDPDLNSRYGDWSWPATIVLNSNGTEIVKRRGYLPPQQMASLLQAIIDDPSPGPSVTEPTLLAKTDASQLAPKQKTALIKSYNALYDRENGGWGRIHKLIDADSLELAYLDADSGRATHKALGTHRARITLNENLLLIDPVWGGVYQYSDALNWRSPHFEKLMSYQADDLRLYAEAYSRWHDPHYLSAANSIFSYVQSFLTAKDGGFFVSQDADVSHETSGHDFYPQDDATRRRLGMPKIDTHEYTREAGWAIRALAKFYDVTGNEQALHSAQHGARWALANRRLAGKGFRHDQQDHGGPFLDDNLAMSQAFLALYRSTGDRNWLSDATATLDFIDATFRNADGGFFTAPPPQQTRGVFKEPVRLADQNAALVRVANMANRYTGNPRYRELAIHGMQYLSAVAASREQASLPEILLADRELSTAPIHIAIVGAKLDPAARSLHSAALKYPVDYLQVDWLDRAEGDLPNHEIQYPDMGRAAAFACAEGACSSPIYEAGKIDLAVRKALLR